MKVKCDRCGDILFNDHIDGPTYDISFETLHLHMHCQKCCADFNATLAECYKKNKSDENEYLKLISKHDIDITNLTIDEQIYLVKNLLKQLRKEKRLFKK